MAYRQRILAARDAKPYEQLRQELGVADDALSLVKLTGDLVIAAFFSASKERDRIERLNALGRQLVQYTSRQGRIEDGLPLTEAADALRCGEKPIEPFHWEIEFPEVFGRENGGFDAMVGNPPFLGGTRISEVDGMSYFQWLIAQYPPSEHHCDLVAYFLRRSFDILRRGGCFGLLATNTVAQGDTREGGLHTVIRHGGYLYAATRRYRWPGIAAVVVSIVHVSKHILISPILLDGRPVKRVSAFLVEGTADDNPLRLAGNPYFSLESKIYGQGFLFADNDPECTPLVERDWILQRHPNWTDRIRPYLGGEEINSHPQQEPQRYVINLSDLTSEADLELWPELKAIVESKVKSGRLCLGDNPNNIPLKRRWWAFQAHRPELYSALAIKTRALCISRVSQFLAFAFAPADIIFSEQVVIFDLDTFSSFAVMQSRLHEVWVRFFASSLEDRLRYTPSDCFETFPFPENFETLVRLEAIGNEYYEFRAQLMIANNEGLTKTYNRFHDPNERSPEIQKLRKLHDAMDRAVLDAYGWTDLVPICEFLLDYEEDEDDEGAASRRKKPWRYRWPDDIRDEVLVRLLELNKQRAEQERLAGLAAEAATGMSQGRKKLSSTATSRRKQSAPNTAQPDLLGR